MSDDIYINNGFNSIEMASFARKQRVKFGILTSEFVDIVSLIEFKLEEIFPGFRMRIVDDFADQGIQAEADIENNCINIREDIYLAASDGDVNARMTLAHELGHYLLHQKFDTRMQKQFDKNSYTGGVKNKNMMESGETQADVFARFFLVDLSSAYKNKSNPAQLAQNFGIPLPEAKSAITISKRIEAIGLRKAKCDCVAGNPNHTIPPDPACSAPPSPHRERNKAAASEGFA